MIDVVFVFISRFSFRDYLLKSNHVCEGFLTYPSVVIITLGILGIPPEAGLTLGTFTG